MCNLYFYNYVLYHIIVFVFFQHFSLLKQQFLLHASFTKTESTVLPFKRLKYVDLHKQFRKLNIIVLKLWKEVFGGFGYKGLGKAFPSCVRALASSKSSTE